MRAILWPEFLGQPNEDSFGTPNVAQSVHIFVLNYLINKLRAKLVEPGKRIIEVLYGEHDT